MVRVSHYQDPTYLLDGEALGAMDITQVLELYNFYARTRPMVAAHRGLTNSQLVPWPTDRRTELAMLQIEDNSNDWGMATVAGDGTDSQSRFVIPMEGFWLVSAFAAVPHPSSSTHTGRWRLEICKVPASPGLGFYDNAQIETAREDHQTLGTTDTFCNLATGTIMWCYEGEEVFARVFQTTGADIAVAGTSGGNALADCRISMIWLSGPMTPVAFVPPDGQATGNVPDDNDWTDIVNSALYVVRRPTVKVGNTGSGTGTTSATFTSFVMNSESTSPHADDNDWHSTTVNSSRVTVPTGRGGLYLVGASVAGPHQVDVTCQRALSVVLNGTTHLLHESLRQAGKANTSGPVISVGPSLIQLAAGDYIEAQWFQNSGANVTVGGTGGVGEDPNIQPANAQLYAHQVQEGSLFTAFDWSPNGYLAANSVMTAVWWNQYLRNNGIALVRDVRATQVRRASTQSVASGSWVNIQWAAQVFDNHTDSTDMWNAGNSTRLTAATGMAGWYLVGGQLEFQPTGATRRMLAVRLIKNATDTFAMRGVTSESAAFTTLNIPATLVYLDEGDFIQMGARHNVGSSINVAGNTIVTGNLWALWCSNPVEMDPP